jgi:hypothetical protein
MLDKILSLIKLPKYVILLIFIITCILLFIPDNLIETLQLHDFINEYKKYIGITFLFSIGFLLANATLYIIKYSLPKQSDKTKYLEILESLSDILLLYKWDNFIDNALRGIVISDFIFNQELFSKFILTTIWPSKYMNLKKIIFKLNKNYNEYIGIFVCHAEFRGGYFKEDKFYANEGKWNDNYDDDLERYKIWSRKWFQALNNYTYTLNKLIDLSNKYFSDEDKFPECLKTKKTMDDSLGVYCTAYAELANFKAS